MKSPNKKKTPRYTLIRSALRNMWMMSDERKAALKRAHVTRHFYRCELCREVVPAVEVDHVIPVGPAPGSKAADFDITWDGLIGRLFCPATCLQILCLPCHKAKKSQ